jgi:hypothetical protein
MSNQSTVVVVQTGQNDGINIGFFAVLLLAAFVAMVIQYFWMIFAVCAALVAAALIYRRAQQQRRLANEADYQNHQYLAGDVRGIYGDFDEGSKQ